MGTFATHHFQSLATRTALVALMALACFSLTFAQDTRQLVQDKPKVSDKRIALVIGNGRYQKVSQLDNPVNDATDMAVVLQGLGFEVIKGTDTNLVLMRRLIREFG